MQYTEVEYTGKYSELILNIWKFQIDEGSQPYVHELMPEETVSIVFIKNQYFKGITILGPQTKKNEQQVYPGSVYMGIRINPWIKIDSIHGNKVSIVNKIIEIPDFVSQIFQEVDIDSLSNNFSERQIEEGLQRLVKDNHVVSDSLVKYICLRLREDIKINELVKEIPLSIRPIQKHFKSVTGISMTDYRNILRLQKTIKSIYLKKMSVSNAAFENGYSDHAHYIKTFKKYMDNTSMKDFFQMTDKISLSFD